MNEKQLVVFRSIWFWWFLATIAYDVGGFLVGTGNAPTLIGHIWGFLGLFVPYGLLSLILFISPLSWVSLVVFIALMIFIDRRLNMKNLGLGKRILLNLLALLILTTLVDLIRGTSFESWNIFFQGKYSNYGG